MCGINGIWMYKKYRVDKRLLSMYEESLRKIDNRGGHATGIYFNGKIIKMPLRVKDFLRVIHTINRNYALGTKEILGHTRFATVGDYNNNYNNHPFETETFVFAHNGSHFSIVEPSKSIVDKYSGTIPETDSFQILASIQMLYNEGQSIPDAIEDTINLGYGAYAFWLYDKKDDKLYLFKEDNPLHMVQSKGFIMFASQRTQLPKKLQCKAFSLVPDTLYEIDRKGTIRKHKLDIEDNTYYYMRSYKGWDDYTYGNKGFKKLAKKKYGTIKVTKKGQRVSNDSVLNTIYELSSKHDLVSIFQEDNEKITLLLLDDRITDELIEYLDEAGVYYTITYNTKNYVELEVYK